MQFCQLSEMYRQFLFWICGVRDAFVYGVSQVHKRLHRIVRMCITGRYVRRVSLSSSFYSSLNAVCTHILWISRIMSMYLCVCVSMILFMIGSMRYVLCSVSWTVNTHTKALEYTQSLHIDTLPTDTHAFYILNVKATRRHFNLAAAAAVAPSTVCSTL